MDRRGQSGSEPQPCALGACNERLKLLYNSCLLSIWSLGVCFWVNVAVSSQISLIALLVLQPGFELYHSVGVQISIPYNKDMYVLLRISTFSCGSIDEISILRLIRELNCEIVRETMPGLITGGVAMPTFQAEDVFSCFGGLFCCVCFFCVSPQHIPCLLRLFAVGLGESGAFA